ncbi:MAG: hypothetical protein PHD70_03660 [Anaerostipes sp.]|nr:hypothetical protein [Anaerostipes sp.]MDD3745556.1 hypothetical protein [Anaerostipes sp.]MDD4371435.1 hypothetical protein [Anaerostipes sp.]
MENLINEFVALSNKEKEYFILAIAPEICKIFEKDANSIPKVCESI